GYFAASTFHAMTAKMQKTWRSGTSLMMVYTFGISIDDSIAGSSGQNNRAGGYQDINNRRSSRAPSTCDVTNPFVLTGTYALPFGKGKPIAGAASAPVHAIIGGWQANAITTFQGGLPFTPTMAASNLNNAGAYQLPNRACEGSLPTDQRSISRWFD